MIVVIFFPVSFIKDFLTPERQWCVRSLARETVVGLVEAKRISSAETVL